MTSTMRVTVDEAALVRIASLLALKVRPGDVLALHGDLGAGKTTFARALIRSLLDDADAEVPSPTFSLCQTYHAPRMAIAHFDLYRLSAAEEAEEIGLDETLARGLTLIEWPERLGGLLPDTRIDIHLEETGTAETRHLSIAAHQIYLVPDDNGVWLFHFWGDLYGTLLAGILQHHLQADDAAALVTVQNELCFHLPMSLPHLPLWNQAVVDGQLYALLPRLEVLLELGRFHSLLPITLAERAIIAQCDLPRFQQLYESATLITPPAGLRTQLLTLVR